MTAVAAAQAGARSGDELALGRRDVVALVILLLLPWLLFRGVLDLWWADDDLEMLRFLRAHPGADYLWNPAVWRSLPGSVLTPLQFLSLHLDLALFGMAPRAFYAHQLVALGLAAAGSFLALRLWWGSALAAGAAALFLLGRPVASLAAMVPARHYAEAIACGALAVVLFHRAVRRGSRWSAVASAALALAAMGFKETAVPLPLLLAALPLGTLRERLRALAPQAVGWLVYGVYRVVMLGPELLKGYGFELLPQDLPRHLAALPSRAVRLFVVPGLWGTLALLLLAGGLAAVVALRPRSLPRAALAGALALAPVIPVSVELSERYVVTFWLAAVVISLSGLALWMDRGQESRRAATALGLLTLAVFVAVEHRAWAGLRAQAERSDTESRAFLRLGERDVVRGPVAMAAFLGELRRYRNDELGVPGGSAWFEDDLALCLDRFPDSRLWQFDPAVGEVVDETAKQNELRASACAQVRWSAPLRVHLERHAEDVAWDFDAGPGEYAIVLDDGVRSVAAPRRGAFHLPPAMPLRLRVRYASPEGWVTYSDEVALGGTAGETVDWHRP